MKNMILHIAITTLLASMSACSDEMDPVLTQRDWDGTALTALALASLAIAMLGFKQIKESTEQPTLTNVSV